MPVHSPCVRRSQHIRVLGFTTCAVLLTSLIVNVPSLARDTTGQFKTAAPELREWLRSQKSPKTGGLCCDEADGTYAEEDIRGGIYWTRFDKTAGQWIPVPPDVVIKDSNHNGAPVAWWYYERGELKIRCYAPGGGA